MTRIRSTLSSSIATVILYLSWFIPVFAQNQVSATYTAGHIPTSYDFFDPQCNGPMATLNVTLPAGQLYKVTSVQIWYSMTASGNGWMSDQRSYLRCANTSSQELEYPGLGDSPGTLQYTRSASIANGDYLGGTTISFEIWAKRVFWEGNSGCNVLTNRVNNNSWIVTVHFGDELPLSNIGVKQANPVSSLDVAGKIKLADDPNAPVAGMIRWNASSQDFEGYNGSAWVSFTRTSGTWGSSPVTQTAQAIASDGAVNNKLGNSVCISGDYAVVGAPGHNTFGYSSAGKAYIYKRNGTSWLEENYLFASDLATNDGFGNSVSISGDYAIVGANLHDTNGSMNRGKAYIYKRNGTSWPEQAILIASDGAAEDRFGYSVSISGDYAIVGARLHDTNGNLDRGKAYIFKRSGTTWTQEATLIASDGTAQSEFGFSVSISGDYAIVGANRHNTNGNTNQGKAYIFKRNGTAWQQESTLTSPDGAAGDQFGYSVAISGAFALVGATFHDVNGNPNQGKAYFYKRNATSWQLDASFTGSDGGVNDNFGTSVYLSGDYAVVGANRHSTNGNTDRGKAYIFKRNGAVWNQESILIASDGATGDNFGDAVSISNGNVIVGAPDHDTNSQSNRGKVYFFKSN